MRNKGIEIMERIMVGLSKSFVIVAVITVAVTHKMINNQLLGDSFIA